MINPANLAGHPTRELRDEFNRIAELVGEKTVNRFSDHKTAVRRVAEMHKRFPKHVRVLAATIAEPELTPEQKAELKSKARAESVAARQATTAQNRAERAAQKKAEADAAAAEVARRLEKSLCPLCGADASSQTANGPEGTYRGENQGFCHECSGAYDLITGARRSSSDLKSATRAAAIAASWANPEVAEKRARRLHITVNGEQFKSVAAAFRAHRLPMGGHIKFRGELRDEGKKTFEYNGNKYKFVLIDTPVEKA